jgi:DNA-binding transcriptional LysR family regulator
LIARIPEQEDDSGLLYEDLSEEIECVVARNGHPLLLRNDLTLKDLSQASWILTSRVGILRNRVDAMFRSAGLECPSDVIEATSMSFILSLIQETDYLHVIPLAVADCYVQSGTLTIVPIDIPCRMANFGIITRRDIALTPGANVLLNQIRAVASELYETYCHE